VYAICTRAFSLSEQAAEDVFQEVFARAYQRLDTVRDDAAIKAWIAQTARRLCVDHIRAGSRESPVAEVELGGADDELARLDEALTVRAALATLSEPCREVLDRFFARDQSYATIGDELEIPAGTIASRISRCLAQLREALEGRSNGPSPSGDRDG
jgi:RNA polymerase sigma-70 factor, ECF subfamily